MILHNKGIINECKEDLIKAITVLDKAKISKEDFIKVVNEINEKTICLDLHSDIEEMLGKEVE